MKENPSSFSNQSHQKSLILLQVQNASTDVLSSVSRFLQSTNTTNTNTANTNTSNTNTSNTKITNTTNINTNNKTNTNSNKAGA